MRPDAKIDDFRPYIGDTFEVEIEEGVLPLTLASATEVLPSIRQHGSFSLIFTGPPNPILAQMTYQVRHQPEDWLLFIVPLEPKDGSARYEVLFN